MSRLLQAQPDPAAVDALLRSEIVRAALLFEMLFSSGAMRTANIQGPFTDLNGVTWHGLGELVGMSDLDGGPDNLAPLREYHLGIPWEFLGADSSPTQAAARMPALLGNPAVYRGRPANLFMQLFDPQAEDVHGRPLAVGVPMALDAGIMTNVGWSFAPGKGGVLLTLKVEGALARKGAPLFGMMTDRDQKRRFPTDNGFRFVPEVMSTQVKWTDW